MDKLIFLTDSLFADSSIKFIERNFLTAEFLLSDKSSWITGQVMHVDGGLSSLKI